MNSNRRTILALIAMGRITPFQAERLLSVIEESRETTRILAICLTFAGLAQLHLHELVPGLMHFFNTRVPVLAEALHHVIPPLTGLWGGLQ